MLDGEHFNFSFNAVFSKKHKQIPVTLEFLQKIRALYSKEGQTWLGRQYQEIRFLWSYFFVMLPIPGTGVYAGSIASYLFKMDVNKAFMANAIGIFFSSIIVWVTTLLTMKGIA